MVTRRNSRSRRTNPPTSSSTLRARYLLGAGIVHTGEYMAMLVATYLVFHETHSIAATGLILLCFNAPSLVLAGSATRISRRYGAARVDAWVNLSEGVWALFPVILVANRSPQRCRDPRLGSRLWRMRGSQRAQLVSRAPAHRRTRQAPRAQQCLHRNVAAAAVVGLLLGGALFVLVGPLWVSWAVPSPRYRGVGLLLDVASPRRSARGATSESFADALRLLRYEPGLWAAFRYAALCFFVASYVVTLPAIANSISTNAEVLSVLESASLIGGILVAHVVRKIHGRVRWGEVQRLCYFGAGMGIAAMALAEVLAGSHSRTSDIVAIVATIPIGFAVLMNASIVTQ